MSQRIQDLIKQATIRVNNPIVNSDGKIVCDDWEQGVSLSKFAELIVRECAGIFAQEGTGRYEVDGNWIAKTIKQHFGVEE